MFYCVRLSVFAVHVSKPIPVASFCRSCPEFGASANAPEVASYCCVTKAVDVKVEGSV